MMISIKTPKKDMIRLSPSCNCEACQHGCYYGSGTLADNDAGNIAKFLNINEKELKQRHLEEIEKFNTKRLRPKILRKGNKPYGRCTFFDEEKKCRIHDVKPLECSITSGCKPHAKQASHWFTLNFFVNKNDAESVRQWAQFLKNNETIPGGNLDELMPNKARLARILSYEIFK